MQLATQRLVTLDKCVRYSSGIDNTGLLDLGLQIQLEVGTTGNCVGQQWKLVNSYLFPLTG